MSVSRPLPLLLLILGACRFDVSAVVEVYPSADAGAPLPARPDGGIPSDAGPDAGAAPDGPVRTGSALLDAGAPAMENAGAVEDAPAPAVAPAASCAPDLPPGGGEVVVSAESGIVELARWRGPTTVHRSLGPVAQIGSRRAWVFGKHYAAATPVSAGIPLNQPRVAWDAADAIGWAAEPPSAVGDLLRLADGDTVGATGLLPSSLVAHGSGGLLFGVRSVDVMFDGVWIAELTEGAASASNRRRLFGPDDPLFAYGAVRTRDHLTLYACDPTDFASACYAARVQNGQEERRDAYQVRTRDARGAWTWSSDLRSGTAVLRGVDKDLSILFSPYLQRYVAVHGGPREPGRASLVLHTAHAPEGPWTEQFALLLPPTPAWWPIHVRAHEALADPCRKRLVVSYFFPTQASDDAYRFPVAGETVLGTLELTRR